MEEGRRTCGWMCLRKGPSELLWAGAAAQHSQLAEEGPGQPLVPDVRTYRRQAREEER